MVFVRWIEFQARAGIAINRPNPSFACIHALVHTLQGVRDWLPDDGDGDPSAVRAGAVFPEKDALPGSEVALAAFDGDCE